MNQSVFVYLYLHWLAFRKLVRFSSISFFKKWFEFGSVRVYKVNENWNRRKKSLFRRKEKSFKRSSFYQFVFRKTVFLLNAFAFLQIVCRQRNFRNKVSLHENKQVSVIQSIRRIGIERERKKRKRYIVWKNISSSTKWTIRYLFSLFFHGWKISFSSHMSLKNTIFVHCTFYNSATI